MSKPPLYYAICRRDNSPHYSIAVGETQLEAEERAQYIRSGKCDVNRTLAFTMLGAKWSVKWLARKYRRILKTNNGIVRAGIVG